MLILDNTHLPFLFFVSASRTEGSRITIFAITSKGAGFIPTEMKSACIIQVDASTARFPFCSFNVYMRMLIIFMRKKENRRGRVCLYAKTYFSTYIACFFSASEIILKGATICLCRAAKLRRYVIRTPSLPLSLFREESSAYVFHLSAWLRWACIEGTFVTLLTSLQSRSIPAITSPIAPYFSIRRTFDRHSVSFSKIVTRMGFFFNRTS